MDEKEIQEAEYTEKNTITQPTIPEPEAKIESVGTVTNNIKEVKKQAIKLKEYYEKVIITEDNLNEAKTEKANVNKVKTKIADFRKEIISEFKKPIDEFEKTAKETENILTEAYEIINSQCNSFDEQKKNEIKEKLRIYFEEYKASKNLGFTQYADMNQSVSLSDISEKGTIAKKKYKEIADFIDSIVNDVDTIEKMKLSDEILVEYIKNRDLANSIKIVQDRHYVMSCLKEAEQNSKPLEVEDKKEEITILKAPVIKKKVTEYEEMVEDIFKVTTTLEKMIKLANFMKEEGITYESVTE